MDIVATILELLCSLSDALSSRDIVSAGEIKRNLLNVVQTNYLSYSDRWTAYRLCKDIEADSPYYWSLSGVHHHYVKWPNIR